MFEEPEDMKLKDFFGSLYARCSPDSFIEFRPISENGIPMQREYLRIDDYLRVIYHCRFNMYFNCFFGIATRDGKGGTKDNIIHIPALWCDVDFRYNDRKNFRKKLKEFQFPPSIKVFSGGGYHLYWILREPLEKTHIFELEDINRRIATALDGDQNACDAARILRVPWTLNYKYDPPKMVKVRKIESIEYEFKDFAILLKGERGISRKPKKSKHGNWLIEAMHGVGKGERNNMGARIAGYFLNKLNKKDLLIIMRMWNCNNEPPLKFKELENIVNSISRYERGTSKNVKKNKTQNKKIRLSIG
jgi:hypothetical protein